MNRGCTRSRPIHYDNEYDFRIESVNRRPGAPVQYSVDSELRKLTLNQVGYLSINSTFMTYGLEYKIREDKGHGYRTDLYHPRVICR